MQEWCKVIFKSLFHKVSRVSKQYTIFHSAFCDFLLFVTHISCTLSCSAWANINAMLLSDGIHSYSSAALIALLKYSNY